jgi:glycyl-tRNA synthetase beta chain
VVRPRLSDAKFFFEQDKKKTLEARLPLLENVVYHNKLGTQAERSKRVVALAKRHRQRLGYDAALAERGALLSKADLLTDMVGEFPELQGIMGTYYARHDGEPDEVALTATEHYQPRFAGDALPSTNTGTVVALADKLETLVGIWGIGLQPTGEKDPFALRRHALGVLRMLVEKRMTCRCRSCSLPPKTSRHRRLHRPGRGSARLHARPPARHAARARLHAERSRSGAGPDLDRLHDIVERLDAVQAFAALPEAPRWPPPTSASPTSSRRPTPPSAPCPRRCCRKTPRSSLFAAMNSACARRSTRPSRRATSPAP